MPSGKDHNRFNQSLFIPIIFLAVALNDNSFYQVVLGIAISINYLNPDLDIKNSKPAQNWGILKFYWSWYASIFPHRGKFSHSIIGSIIRIIWLSPFLVGFIYYYWSKIDWRVMANVITGIITGDLFHLLLDKVMSRSWKQDCKDYYKKRK